jgi:hypothetical protein
MRRAAWLKTRLSLLNDRLDHRAKQVLWEVSNEKEDDNKKLN